ncbi:MAG: DUF5915 domain-containing protein, partial [Eubacteriales bacterium]|nr:DUF5915 domain-containing protein [Eubacteriales bacterium]
DLIMEELNVKEVVFEKDLDTFMNLSLKPNFKVAGPILGSKIKAFASAIAKADPVATVAALENDGRIVIDIDGKPVTVEKDFVEIKISAKEGFAIAMENRTFVVLDTTITNELQCEGLAREMISKVQQMRKQKDFEMMDRIRIYYHGNDEVKKALKIHRDYIMKETLALELIEKGQDLITYDLNGHKTGIDVERV